MILDHAPGRARSDDGYLRRVNLQIPGTDGPHPMRGSSEDQGLCTAYTRDDFPETLWRTPGEPMAIYKRILRKLANSVGYEIKALDSLENVRVLTARLLRAYGVDLILDVGANSGQYGRYLREDIGYSGQIVSFEPQSAAFESLAENAKGDPLWRTIKVGLGNVVERRRINIAGNSLSSSFLNMLPAHELAAPASRYVSQEDVDVVTLDSIFQSFCTGTESRVPEDRRAGF